MQGLKQEVQKVSRLRRKLELSQDYDLRQVRKKRESQRRILSELEKDRKENPFKNLSLEVAAGERLRKVRRRLMERIKATGWSHLGEGMDRVVYGHPDKPYVLKFSKARDGTPHLANRAEWFLCNNIPDPLRKHFAEALYLYNRGEVLVQERVEKTWQAEIDGVFRKFKVKIRDLHGENRGFRIADKTPVVLDYAHSRIDFKHYEESTIPTASEEVRAAYKKYWAPLPWTLRFIHWVDENFSRKVELHG